MRQADLSNTSRAQYNATETPSRWRCPGLALDHLLLSAGADHDGNLFFLGFATTFLTYQYLTKIQNPGDNNAVQRYIPDRRYRMHLTAIDVGNITPNRKMQWKSLLLVGYSLFDSPRFYLQSLQSISKASVAVGHLAAVSTQPCPGPRYLATIVRPIGLNGVNFGSGRPAPLKPGRLPL